MSPNLRRGLRRQVTTVDFERFDAVARRAIVVANLYAVDANQASIGTEHLVCAFVTPPARDEVGLAPTLEDVGRALTERGYHLGTTTTGPVSETGMPMRPFTKEVKAIIVDGVAKANAAEVTEVTCAPLLLAVLDRPKSLGARVLLDLGVDPAIVAATWASRRRDEGPPNGAP